MEKLINFFKRIWNYFFGKKKVTDDSYAEPLVKKEHIRQPEAARKIIVNKQQFRKHQLIGKIYHIGKSRFRIKKKLGLTDSEKLRYEITQL